MSSLRRWLPFFGLLALAAPAVAACSDADTSSADEDESAYRKKRDAGADASDAATAGHIQLLVTVDWEGRDLLDSNLAAMEDLRRRYPDVKIVHFLNAAYFTKPGAIASDVEARMNRVLRPGDERGLHIHGWKRLFEAAGVTFRSTPNFWGTNTLSNDCNFDCGHEVPISAYTTQELQKVVRYSLDTLESHGFGRAKSFRCGGWVAQPNVRDAIAAEGIKYENSAVPSAYLAGELQGLPLLDWVDTLWRGTTSTTQPYTLTTAAGPIMEVPDNGALSDYVTGDEMADVFEANERELAKTPTKNQVVSIGFHEETASRYVTRLEAALDRIYAEAKRDGVVVDSVTSESLVAR